MTSPFTYRGRFAPSPTGPLHFGSLVAAVGSYLDARHHQGKWRVRIEDLDTPRCVPGAADDILRTLDAFGLHWDEDILYQSQRTDAYEAALSMLQASGAAYPCCCTRKEIADSALHGIEGPVYPGTCRNGIPAGREGRAWRVRTDMQPPVRTELGAQARSPDVVSGLYARSQASTSVALPATLSTNGEMFFDDVLQGRVTQHLEREIGDFVVKRADGLFAYQLAVVVDDAFQGITDVVRGADLLYSTPRQIYLQQLLGLATPRYLHLPVAVNAAGEKLSKQTRAQPLDARHATETLFAALAFLRQHPPAALRHGGIAPLLAWATEHWQPHALLNCRQVAMPESLQS